LGSDACMPVTVDASSCKIPANLLSYAERSFSPSSAGTPSRNFRALFHVGGSSKTVAGNSKVTGGHEICTATAETPSGLTDAMTKLTQLRKTLVTWAASPRASPKPSGMALGSLAAVDRRLPWGSRHFARQAPAFARRPRQRS
jgi:hypothetical protein